MIVHLNGWPGVGKKTVGLILAKKLSGRFIENHLLHDVAIACSGIDSPNRWDLYSTIQSAAYAALAKLPKTEIVVMTNALCKNSEREVEAWSQVVQLAIDRGSPLIPVILVASREENIRRVQSADRIGRKLTDPDDLLSYFGIDAIQTPDVRETFTLDTTELNAEGAAEIIARHIERELEILRPATAEHLKLR